MGTTDYTTNRSADLGWPPATMAPRTTQTVRDYDVTLPGPGSVLSTVADMASYAEWLLHGGAGVNGDVLATETLAEMMSPQYSVDPRLPVMDWRSSSTTWEAIGSRATTATSLGSLLRC